MARILKREAAKRDLIAQWVWYAENAGIEVADRFLIAADSTLNLLSNQPGIGSPFFVRNPSFKGCADFRFRTASRGFSSSTSHTKTEWNCSESSTAAGS